MHQQQYFVTPLFLGLVFVPATRSESLAQVSPPAIEWETTFARDPITPQPSWGHLEAAARSRRRQTDDGGYVVAGTEPPTHSFSDVYLLKTDPDGNLLWRRKFGGDGRDVARWVEVTYDGGIILAGSADGQVYLVKTDSEGQPVWERKFTGEAISAAEAFAIAETPCDQGYVVTGWARLSEAGQGGGHRVGGTGNDAYLLKTDREGNLLWGETYSGEEYGVGVEPTGDGGFILVTEIGEGFGFLNRVSVLKTDSQGKLLWKKSVPGAPWSFATGWSVRETRDRSYLLVGSIVSEHDEFGAARGSDVCLARLDSAGNFLWKKTIAEIGFQRAHSLEETTDYGYILAGGFGQITGASDRIYVVKTDREGNLLWQRTLGAEGSRAVGASAHQTRDGGYIVAGSAETASDGIYLIKLAPDDSTTTIVAPTGLESLEGNQSFRGSGPVRFQQIFPLEGFDALPGPLEIHQIAWRADGPQGTRQTVCWEHARVRLSTKEGAPELGTRFAGNIGADETTVYEASLEMTPRDFGPPDGPKEFDHLIRLERPFLYDPAKGHLVLDFQSRTGSSTFLVVDSDNSALGETLLLSVDPDAPVEDCGAFGCFHSGIVTRFTFCAPRLPRFRRGDCNADGTSNVTDAVCILKGVFGGGPVPGCVAATDTNGDDEVNVTDATYLLNHLFAGGPAPVAPFPDCGPGMLPADAELGCANPPECQ